MYIEVNGKTVSEMVKEPYLLQVAGTKREYGLMAFYQLLKDLSLRNPILDQILAIRLLKTIALPLLG